MVLGQLNRLKPNEVWNDERSFNSWLKDNFRSLSEKLGVEIEILDVESSVGRFYSDIVGRELSTNKLVIVESQFGPTDHDHLGKLLTYSAGKDAGIIVWLSSEFRDEHLSVLDWLNNNTGEEISFFGVELELLQIDGSKPALNLKVVSKPDEWQRTLREEHISEKGLAYKRFFELLLGRLKEEIPGFTTATKAYPENWFSVGAGKSGIHFSFSFTRDLKYRVELYITTGDRIKNKEIFDNLHSDREQIEKEIGDLSWERLEDKKDCRIAAYRDAEIMEIIDDENTLNEMLSWSVDMARKFKETFSPRIIS